MLKRNNESFSNISQVQIGNSFCNILWSILYIFQSNFFKGKTSGHIIQYFLLKGNVKGFLR